MSSENEHTPDWLPLTQSQIQLWTGQRLQPDEPLYNMVHAFRIAMPVDPARFQQAFDRLIADSDAMRARVREQNGVPRQQFAASLSYPLPLVDLSGDAAPDQAARAWVRERGQKIIDLSHCHFDAALLRLADDMWVWYFNTHHLFADAWSVGLLYRRMQHLYGLAREGRLDDAGDMPAYRDYVLHEQTVRDGKQAERCAAYWGPKLEQPPHPVSFYRRVPSDCGGRTDRVPLAFGAGRTAALRELAADARFRSFLPDLFYFQVFATVLLAWMHRLSGHRELALGTPAHNRGSNTWKETAGLFIETFPLQVDAEADDTFLSLYRKVADASYRMFTHSGPGMSTPAHNRAYHVLLNYITASFGPFDGAAASSEWVHSGHGDRNHLLRVQVHDFDQADALDVYFDMNVDALVGDERDLAQAHFLSLFDALLADAESTISSIALNDTPTEAALLATGRGPSAPPATRTCLAAFEAQAAATPDRTAVRCGEQALTYAELDRCAGAFAARLAAAGVAHGDTVALLLQRSPAAVIATLAAWKLGAAWLPLDPAYPRARNAGVIDQSGARVLLVHEATQSSMPDTAVPMLAVDDIDSADVETAADTAFAPAALGDTAYIIYTSGSTGVPKGVVVKHASLANYVDWAGRTYAPDEETRFALFSSLAFDLTVTSLVTPLTRGGTIVVYPERGEGREVLIQKVIEDDAVDVIKLTPAHLALIQSMDLSAARVKRLVVGGEDFKTDLAFAIDRCSGGRIEIYNEYGPTEGTVACMIHRYDPLVDTHTSVPIGRPIDNLEIYILNAGGALALPGTVGEMAIGGAGVAAGYHRRDDLSAERFVANPFRRDETLYLTGDLGRWGPDGVLEYLGRTDQQVKVRGVRIETAEIESALLAHEAISEAAVAVVDRRQDAAAADNAGFCKRCGLDGRHPDAFLDDQSVCRICRIFEAESTNARRYFRDGAALDAIVNEAKAWGRQLNAGDGGQDCMMLLSGGKDSTFALCQLVDMGLTPLVFTLDNGYISEGAKANMRRVTERLGLELIVGSTPHMNAIFVDSLSRQSNVCQGCFKTIYTLSMKVAEERGIRHIFTGLSRGQIFETRVSDMFQQRVFDPDEIDRTIISARKVLHRMDDVISRCLDTSIFNDDEIFDRIRFVDYYRYTDVTLDEMYDYLSHQAPWIRPDDTGRSTNCLINEAGIHVHKTERGYHNYSMPYSWDVRLGHKERDAAREELDDNIDVANVNRILDEIGYTIKPPKPAETASVQLVAYYVADQALGTAELRDFLADRLPDEFVPTVYMPLDEMPLTPNGKLDRAALPAPDAQRRGSHVAYVAPRNTAEQILAAVWADVLDLEQVGINDDFFELGGDSILNIQIVTRARRRGISINPQQIFDHPTVAELAAVVDTGDAVVAEQGPVTGEVTLTPVQRRYLTAPRDDYSDYCQSMVLSLPAGSNPAHITSALRGLMLQHDALRAAFTRDPGSEGGWLQTLQAPDDADCQLIESDWRDAPPADETAALGTIATRLQDSMDIARGQLVAAAHIRRSDSAPDLLYIMIHHLAVDGVSWWILLEDFAAALESAVDGKPLRLPAKTSSMREWTSALASYATSDTLRDELAYWTVAGAADAPGVDRAAGAVRIDRIGQVEAALDSAQTDVLLRQMPTAARAQLPEILATALACQFADRDGLPALRVDFEGHGREEIASGLDLVRTVGWFTNIYPVTIDTGDDGHDFSRALPRVKAAMRAVPRRGIGYSVLRYLGDEAAQTELAALPDAPVLFNYLGQWDAAMGGGESVGLHRALAAHSRAGGETPHLLGYNLVVFQDRLRLELHYSEAHFESTTAQSIADTYMKTLAALIDDTIANPQLTLTAADLPDAQIDQDELDDLMAELDDLDDFD